MAINWIFGSCLCRFFIVKSLTVFSVLKLTRFIQLLRSSCWTLDPFTTWWLISLLPRFVFCPLSLSSFFVGIIRFRYCSNTGRDFFFCFSPLACSIPFVPFPPLFSLRWNTALDLIFFFYIFVQKHWDSCSVIFFAVDIHRYRHVVHDNVER